MSGCELSESAFLNILISDRNGPQIGFSILYGKMIGSEIIAIAP